MSEGTRAATADPVSRLLELLERRRPLLTTTPIGTPRQLAAGGLARGEALLRGLCLVIDAGREDLAGLFTRAIWECWCVGLYVLLGGPDKYAELEESHRRWLKVYADRWPDEAEKLSIDDRLLNGLGSSPAAPTIEQMAKEVETMLRTADTGPVRYGSFSSYDVFYRLESAFSAHAGVALFERYLEPSEDGSRDEVVASPSSETLRRSAAPLAAAYLAHFGWHVYRAFGISTSELDGLLVQLLEPLGMLIHGADPHGVS